MPRNFTPDREDRIKLYEIREDITETLTPDPETPFDPARLEELDLKFDEKTAGCVAFIKNLKAHEAALDAEIKRLEAKKNTAANDRKSLTAYVLSNLQQAERTEAGQGMHKARIQKNSQPSVIVQAEHRIPDRFVEIQTKVLNREIAKWYKKTGEIVDGTDIVEGEHLRIS